MDKSRKVGETHGMRTYLWAVLLLAGLAGCDAKPPRPAPPPAPLPPVGRNGELVVVTRESPTTYYEDAEGKPAGMEHDLVQLFGDAIGARVRFVLVDQFNQVLSTLSAHRAHLAAASVAITPERVKRFKFSAPYQTVQIQVAYNTNSDEPSGVKGPHRQGYRSRGRLELRGTAARGESQVSGAEMDREHRQGQRGSARGILALGNVQAVVSDSNTIAVTKNFHPEIDVGFDLSDNQPLAWAFPKDVDPVLFKQAQAFFAQIRKDGTLKRLLDRYYGHVNRLERADVEGLMVATNAVLPKLRRLFLYSQEITDIDWRLVAAVGYQESHWNPLATSPTGVRGLMMLTNDTADTMGVTDRLDPKQNIIAGARYMQYLKDTVPEQIPEPDRTWTSLAAYNLGYGHVEDARILAKRMKLNPDSWTDLKLALPLLAKSDVQSSLKHGYARGGEAVVFVENIRTCYDILAKFETAYQPVFSDRPPNAARKPPAVSKRLRLAAALPAKTSLGFKPPPAPALR